MEALGGYTHFLSISDRFFDKSSTFVTFNKGKKEMEVIRYFVEEIIIRCGVHGAGVPILRHVLLIVVVVLLAWLS